LRLYIDTSTPTHLLYNKYLREHVIFATLQTLFLTLLLNLRPTLLSHSIIFLDVAIRLLARPDLVSFNANGCFPKLANIRAKNLGVLKSSAFLESTTFLPTLSAAPNVVPLIVVSSLTTLFTVLFQAFCFFVYFEIVVFVRRIIFATLQTLLLTLLLNLRPNLHNHCTIFLDVTIRLHVKPSFEGFNAQGGYPDPANFSATNLPLKSSASLVIATFILARFAASKNGCLIVVCSPITLLMVLHQAFCVFISFEYIMVELPIGATAIVFVCVIGLDL